MMFIKKTVVNYVCKEGTTFDVILAIKKSEHYLIIQTLVKIVYTVDSKYSPDENRNYICQRWNFWIFFFLKVIFFIVCVLRIAFKFFNNQLREFALYIINNKPRQCHWVSTLNCLFKRRRAKWHDNSAFLRICICIFFFITFKTCTVGFNFNSISFFFSYHHIKSRNVRF